MRARASVTFVLATPRHAIIDSASSPPPLPAPPLGEPPTGDAVGCQKKTAKVKKTQKRGESVLKFSPSCFPALKNSKANQWPSAWHTCALPFRFRGESLRVGGTESPGKAKVGGRYFIPNSAATVLIRSKHSKLWFRRERLSLGVTRCLSRGSYVRERSKQAW